MPNIKFNHQSDRDLGFLKSKDDAVESRFLPFVKPTKKNSVAVPRLDKGGPKISTIDKIAEPKYGNHHYFYSPNSDMTIGQNLVAFDLMSPK